MSTFRRGPFVSTNLDKHTDVEETYPVSSYKTHRIKPKGMSIWRKQKESESPLQICNNYILKDVYFLNKNEVTNRCHVVYVGRTLQEGEIVRYEVRRDVSDEL